LRVVGWDVVRRLLLVEIRHVLALPLLAVPPDVALALGPGIPLRVGRGPVVEDAPVRRPCPRPLRRDIALLPVRLLPRRLVDAVSVDAAIDPAAAGRGAVRL